LLGLFSVICLLLAEHSRTHRIRINQRPCYVKTEPTLSDAIAAVQRLFWEKTILQTGPCHDSFQKLSPKSRGLLLHDLSRAA
jgi:hypothetical protein